MIIIRQDHFGKKSAANIQKEPTFSKGTDFGCNMIKSKVFQRYNFQ